MILDFGNRDLYNPVYLPFFADMNRYKILYGGRDSGKSDFVAQWIITKLLSEEFFRHLLVRRFYADIKRSQFQTILDYIRIWEIAEYFHITHNPLSIMSKINANKLIARGLDKSDNTKSTKDPTGAWYEEADQITPAGFKDTTRSIRTSMPNAKLFEWLTFNPSHEQCWINKYFFPEKKNLYEKPDGRFHWVKSPRKDTTILHTNYRDNRYCTADRVALLEDERERRLDENYYKVNTLGLWGGALKGLIYPSWTPVEEIPSGGDEAFGLDYGYNNATALIQASFKENRLYAKELIYVTHHNHQQVVNLMLADHKERIGKNPIYVDSAEPALTSMLRRAGFNARPTEKGANSVYDGIMQVKQFDLSVANNSDNLMNELTSYVWKEERASGNILDEPVKVDDHAMDALRYVIQSYGARYWLPQINGSSKSSPYTTNSRRERRTRNDFSGF